MKRLSIFAVCTLLLFGCQRNQSGDVKITGYLMNQCGSTDPVGGVDVTFSINGTDLITTKTDAFGYFLLQGSYSYQEDAYGSPLIKSVVVVSNGQNGGGFGAVYLACQVPDKINLDTIYVENSALVKVQIVSPQIGYGEIGDSLFVGFIKPFYLRADNNDLILWKALALPINDTTWIGPEITIAPSHVGYTFGNCGGNEVRVYYGKTKSYNQYTSLEWIPGQPNHACGRVYDITIDLSK